MTKRTKKFPYERVAKLWEKGKTIAEIAKSIGYVDKGLDSCHTLRCFLSRMHKGYKTASGRTVKLPYRISKKQLKAASKKKIVTKAKRTTSKTKRDFDREMRTKARVATTRMVRPRRVGGEIPVSQPTPSA